MGTDKLQESSHKGHWTRGGRGPRCGCRSAVGVLTPQASVVLRRWREAREASRMRLRVPFWVTDDARKRVWKEKILGAKRQ